MRLKNKMKMVGHETKKVYADLLFLNASFQPVKKCMPISIILKNDSPINPTEGHMINRPLIMNSHFPCHSVVRFSFAWLRLLNVEV